MLKVTSLACQSMIGEGGGPCSPPSVEVGIAGLPCTSWSKAGKMEREEAEVIKLHLTWLHRVLRNAIYVAPERPVTV